MILILGGTAEARSLASLLETHDIPAMSSLAGRVSNPQLPVGEVRIGGFGGPQGLAEYLEKHDITAVVDATHPFAARITANAAAACRATDTPLLILNRTEWPMRDADTWHEARDPEHAASLVETLFDAGAHVLLTTGRQDAAAFAALPNPTWLRAIEDPGPPLPEHCELILTRGPFTLAGERTLFAEKQIDVLVTKNSGGPLTAPKLQAARERGIPVIMIRRPPLPENVGVVDSVDAACTWIRRGSGGG